ncbi:MAG: cation:proton antiporter [Prochlorotrichaceae cyanobacterium]|jgi:CPA2 family monovalent cation:H+ antiporter-2
MASASPDLTLIVDMVTVLGSATIVGYGANRLGQPVLLGYLLGGMIVGPAGLHWVGEHGEIQVLAEVGVALLLFALGVEFSLKELLRVRTIALGGGSLQILFTIVLGGALAYVTGWVETIPTAIFLGSVLSLSSTAVVLKSLIERNEVQTIHGQIMLALLVVQDLSLGLMLAILPALTQPPEVLGQALGIAAVKVLVFMGGALLAGKYLIPTLVRQLARSGSQEIFLLGILVICLGIALVSDRLGLGIAMGAFVAGLMISNMEYADHALDLVLPMRDVFATVFFASIGLLIDPVFLWQQAWILMGLVTIVMVGKACLVTGLVRVFGYPLKTALTVGLGVNQIGEFSFVLAGVAQSQGLFSPSLYNLALGTTAATLLITPFSIKLTPYFIQWLERVSWLNRWFNLTPKPRLFGLEERLRNHVVVVGYGRVGQTLVRMLYFQGYPILVIDNNEAVLQTLRDRQIPYLFGDASSLVVLEKANLHQAMAMAIALPDPVATRLTLDRALSLAPDLDVTVRAHLKNEIESLYQLGAQEVVQPEFEAALEMGAHMLLQLGDSAYAVQQVVQRYRTGHYREIVPERATYWNLRELELALEGLTHHWYEIHIGSPLNGLTLGEANVRRQTGATIMAIDRDRLYQYPTGEMTIQAGDRLLVVGGSQEHHHFSSLLKGINPDVS